MPRRRKATQHVSKNIRNAQKAQSTFFVRKNKLEQFRWGESYTSLLLGIVVVIVVALFGVSIFRQAKHVQQTTSIATGPSVTPKTSPTTAPSETFGQAVKENGKTYYTVKSGDDLWSISEKIYHSGYNWVDIAKANNLADPSTIFNGDKLLIPTVTPTQPEQIVQNTQSNAPNAITSKSYTVQQGDDLWDIAVRAYADGYKWTAIAQANNLVNPDVIHSGNVLTIPR